MIVGMGGIGNTENYSRTALVETSSRRSVKTLRCTVYTLYTVQGGPKSGTPVFCDNFRKCTPILIIYSLLEQEIYDA